MRRVVIIVLASVLAFPAIGRAVSNADTLGTFMQSVRLEMNIKASSILPDTALIDICDRAIRLTAIEIGGCEATYKVNTVANKAFYALPDTITEILGARIISGVTTYQFKTSPPQFFEDMSNDNVIQPGQVAVPSRYSVWHDTLELYPIPSQADSIYIDCFVEHPKLTAKSSVVRLKTDFKEAARSYAIYLAYKRLGEYEVANLYKADYDAKKTELRAKHQPKLDMITQK